MKKINFIYWFAFNNLYSPSVRYRAKYPLDYFRKQHDIESYLVYPGYNLNRLAFFLKAYFSALFFRKKDSIIVIQRVQSNFVYATLLKLLVTVRNENTVYDLDDSDYLEFDPSTIYFFAKKCHKISAGSEHIAKHLRLFNAHIHHTTSPIWDMDIAKRQRNELFTIGWIGGFGGRHKAGMIEHVFPALRELPFPFKFIIMGVTNDEDVLLIHQSLSQRPDAQIIIPRHTDWNNERAIQEEIVKFDVGIATLYYDEIQLSKSGIKAKQYMNNGVPVLSTPQLENSRYVIDGVNGFFCANSSDFKSRLIQLQSMSDNEYAQLSTNARASVKHFDHEQYLAAFHELYNNVKSPSMFVKPVL